MQIMSTNSKLRNFFFSIFTLLLQIPLGISAELPITLQLEKKETICIGKEKNKNLKKCDIAIDPTSVDVKAVKFLEQSDEIFPIFSLAANAGHYLVVVARTPSKLPQSTGYCGSGYEDHLLLLEYTHKEILLRDEFLLQSCLKSISLDAEGGGNILRAIFINREKYTIGFRWLTNPDDKHHILSISKGKFHLN